MGKLLFILLIFLFPLTACAQEMPSISCKNLSPKYVELIKESKALLNHVHSLSVEAATDEIRQKKCPAIQALMRKGETYKINSHIQTGAKEGMILLDDHLFGLWRQQRITYNDMMHRAVDPEQLEKKIRATGAAHR